MLDLPASMPASRRWTSEPASEIDTLARVEEPHERRAGRTVPLTDVAEVSRAS